MAEYYFYSQIKCPYCGKFYSKFLPWMNLCCCTQCMKNGKSICFSECEVPSQDLIDKALIYTIYHETESKQYFLGSKEEYEKISKQLKNTIYADVSFVHITPEQVEAWYPRTFAQKIDYILLYFAEHMKYNGEAIPYTLQMLKSLFFAKTANVLNNDVSETKQQVVYILNYLCEENYIKPKSVKKDGGIYFSNPYVQMSDCEFITLTPKALARIDELQKTLKDTMQVFIAMSFDKSLDKANEAIQRAISDNGYMPRRMDEYAHNNQIVPEMLYQIRQSKFVVADLTGHNNGAYYEAGYASGIGKEVILTCKQDSFESDSHFDVKQLATVIWENEDDLKNKLKTWIEATIGKAN